jgi:hypothetical protein
VAYHLLVRKAPRASALRRENEHGPSVVHLGQSRSAQMRRPRSGRRFGGAHGVLQHRCLLFPSRRTSPRERGALHPGRSLGGETNASPSAKGTELKGRSHGSFDRSICCVCVNSGVDRLMQRFVRCDAAGPARSSSSSFTRAPGTANCSAIARRGSAQAAAQTAEKDPRRGALRHADRGDVECVHVTSSL